MKVLLILVTISWNVFAQESNETRNPSEIPGEIQRELDRSQIDMNHLRQYVRDRIENVDIETGDYFSHTEQLLIRMDESLNNLENVLYKDIAPEVALGVSKIKSIEESDIFTRNQKKELIKQAKERLNYVIKNDLEKRYKKAMYNVFDSISKNLPAYSHGGYVCEVRTLTGRETIYYHDDTRWVGYGCSREGALLTFGITIRKPVKNILKNFAREIFKKDVQCEYGLCYTLAVEDMEAIIKFLTKKLNKDLKFPYGFEVKKPNLHKVKKLSRYTFKVIKNDLIKTVPIFPNH